MKPNPPRRRNRALSSSSSPQKTRPRFSSRGRKVTTSVTLLKCEETSLFNGSGYEDPNPELRTFPYSVKQQCWEKAEKTKGRDPERWRISHLGNIVFRKLVGCPGCLCHDYDHIVPYSKMQTNANKNERINYLGQLRNLTGVGSAGSSSGKTIQKPSTNASKNKIVAAHNKNSETCIN